MVEVTYRRARANGPEQPAEPKQPSQQSAPGVPEMPDFDQMWTAAGAQGAAGGAPAGGENLGGGKISPAPAIPGQSVPAMPPIDLGGGGGEMPGMVPAMRTAEDRAAEETRLTSVKNSLQLPPEIAQQLGLDAGPIDARLLTSVRAGADRKVKLALKGLDENGDPLPAEKLPPEIALKVRGEEAAQQLIAARIGLAHAQASGVAANVQIARQRVAVAERNADTFAAKAANDAALLGMGGGGVAGNLFGGPNFALGSSPAGATDPIQAMADQVLSNQIEFSAVPAKLKPGVSMRIAEQNGIIIPKDLNEKLSQFAEARAVTSEIYDALEDYIKAEGIGGNAEAAYRLKNTVDGLTRLVGRALGEKGVFTDQDKADFRSLLAPSYVITLTTPEMAQRWVRRVEGVFDRVERNRLQGFYRKAYQTREGTVKTRTPGDRSTQREVPEVPKPFMELAPSSDVGGLINSADELRKKIEAKKKKKK